MHITSIDGYAHNYKKRNTQIIGFCVTFNRQKYMTRYGL